ncbi:MAG TPA: bifunctional phosphoglucose/phosphomannose isomerase [Fimbriimonadaceae bacterium]|nr:bifunctional phosphoglucose/phosphomannose isomerase [Fimbriimonadaceae bacterium]
MHDLDRPEFVLRNDPKGMYRLTCEFPDQCLRAIDLGQALDLTPVQPRFAMLTGLGGSAAGGDFVRALFEAEGSIPFVVNRDYHLPAYANRETLVFAVSYSGNTEETLSAYADAQRSGCQRLVVTSGGQLADLARQDGVPLCTIPGGQPPRTALGYNLMPVIVACEQMGLLPAQDYASLDRVLRASVEAWQIEVPVEENEAKRLAVALHGAVSVLYGLGPWQALVANRWKGQINENAKNMTFANAFPELCHNEILGWVRTSEQGVGRWVGIVLRDGTESAKMEARARVVFDLLGATCQRFDAVARGATLLERMLSLVLLGDFVSLYLAALNDVDPENIDWINVLKAELAQVP